MIPTLANHLGNRPLSPLSTGEYDFILKYAPDLAGADSPGPSITALEEQLGLKLESHKMPVEMLVIDHVERTPAEN